MPSLDVYNTIPIANTQGLSQKRGLKPCKILVRTGKLHL